MDKLLESIIRNFVIDTKKLNDSELADYFQNEIYLNIEGFNIDKHLPIIIEIIEENRGLDIIYSKNEIEANQKKRLEKKNKIIHNIAISYCNENYTQILDKIDRIELMTGQTISNTISEYLDKQDFISGDYLFQVGEIIEHIDQEDHFITHFYNVIIDSEKLINPNQISNVNKLNFYIWNHFLSKLSLYCKDKNTSILINNKVDLIKKEFK
tara:strand:- start:48512 stop:49144 length:633 start_codon:yes stop_codon:yes gene_type:complete